MRANVLIASLALLAAWNDYEKTFWPLVQAHEVRYVPGQESHCRAFACFGGFDHPRLAPFEERFVKEVPANLDGLVRDVQHRSRQVLPPVRTIPAAIWMPR